MVHCTLSLTVHPLVVFLEEFSGRVEEPGVGLLEVSYGHNLGEGSDLPLQQLLLIVNRLRGEVVRYARHYVCYIESFQMSGNVKELQRVRVVRVVMV